MSNDAVFARVKGSFDRQTAMTTIGAEMTAATPGEVTIRLAPAPHILQQHGFVHGGVIGMIADSACGYAALSMMPEDKSVLTSEYKINLLAPAVGTAFEAVGRVLRAGKRVHVVQGEVFAIADGKRRQIAVMLATMMVMDKTPGMVD